MKLLDNLINSSNQIVKSGKKNSPAILIFAGIVGMGATMYMVNKVAPDAKDILDDIRENEPEESKPKQIIKEVKAVAPLYLPAALTFTASTVCILGSYKISADRIAALTTAYTFSEAKLTEYQQKVIETIGEKKEKQIRDEIIKDHMDETEVPKEYLNDDILIDGKSLFFDDHSKRYFRISVQELYEAKEEINLRLQQGPVKLNEFYYLIGLEDTDEGDIFEWAEGDSLEYRVTSHLCKDGVTTCAAICYSVPISAEYHLRY